jgi:hypothetical protein
MLLSSAKGGSSRGCFGSLIDVVESSVEAYQAHTPPEITTELDLAESDARVLRHFITDEELL